MTTTAEFWDRIAPKYSKQPIADETSYEKKLKATQALMHRDMAVLEFGCGTGSTAIQHAPFVGHIVATDVSEAMVAIGKEKAEKEGLTNIRFLQNGVEEFHDKSGSYDMILALNLLHLLPGRGQALSKFYDLLKPGGYLVTSTVCLADKRWFLGPLIKVLQWLGKAPYVSFTSPESVMDEARASGFECQEHWTHGRAKSLFLIAKKP